MAFGERRADAQVGGGVHLADLGDRIGPGDVGALRHPEAPDQFGPVRPAGLVPATPDQQQVGARVAGVEPVPGRQQDVVPLDAPAPVDQVARRVDEGDHDDQQHVLGHSEFGADLPAQLRVCRPVCGLAALAQQVVDAEPFGVHPVGDHRSPARGQPSRP
ncbi:hypothetical protein GCM10027615_45250 [Plantactinospora veratri]